MGGHFDLENKINQIKALEESLNDHEIWNHPEKANRINSELVKLKKIIKNYEIISNDLKEYQDIMLTLDDESLVNEIENNLHNISGKLDEIEISNMLGSKYDRLNCYLEIHPGAGGTEACDWADMLARMYQMFCNKNNYHFEIIDFQAGEEAGIKSMIMKIAGDFAYGYFKGEQGVHRLVRISPFDSGARRHTSFASISVIPEIDKEITVELKAEDVRVDVYRSSGKGGQGVNTTDSAVRLTHIPTGIVVTCQNERSQIKNKERAMVVLKAKIYDVARQEQEKSSEALRKGKIGTGDRSEKIRTYNYPQNRITDHRINYSIMELDRIVDGNLDPIIEALITEDQKRKLENS